LPRSLANHLADAFPGFLVELHRRIDVASHQLVELICQSSHLGAPSMVFERKPSLVPIKFSAIAIPKSIAIATAAFSASSLLWRSTWRRRGGIGNAAYRNPDPGKSNTLPSAIYP
jgi:hypothetical protein